MEKLIVMALVSIEMVFPVLAADQSDLRLLLLDQLRIERQAALVNPSSTEAKKPNIDLRPLLGINRSELLNFLGSPDFCALPVDEDCIKSTRLAYFYYPRKSNITKDMTNGLVAITVTAGGGWAMEINLTHDSVTKAVWVKQT